MLNDDRYLSDWELLSRKTRRQYIFRRMVLGMKSLKTNKRNRIVIAAAAAVGVLIFCLWPRIISDVVPLPGGNVILGLGRVMVLACLAVILLILFEYMGTPRGAKQIEENLERAGFVNYIREPPVLLEISICPNNSSYQVLKFDARGIPMEVWKENRSLLETALNMIILDIYHGSDFGEITVLAANPRLQDLRTRK